MKLVLKLCCIFCVRSQLEAGGVDRLMNITRQRSKYTSRVVKFASQVTYTLLQSGFVCLRLAALRHLLVYLNNSYKCFFFDLAALYAGLHPLTLVMMFLVLFSMGQHRELMYCSTPLYDFSSAVLNGAAP